MLSTLNCLAVEGRVLIVSGRRGFWEMFHQHLSLEGKEPCPSECRISLLRAGLPMGCGCFLEAQWPAQHTGTIIRRGVSWDVVRTLLSLATWLCTLALVFIASLPFQCHMQIHKRLCERVKKNQHFLGSTSFRKNISDILLVWTSPKGVGFVAVIAMPFSACSVSAIWPLVSVQMKAVVPCLTWACNYSDVLCVFSGLWSFYLMKHA